MVPADDEHKDTPEGDSNASTEERNSGRLTPMPDCLMHWWTPLLVALILFILSFICAWGWGWHWNWPSSKAMKLCMTITGAGLAFSAWQQRSHDNIAREKDALAKQEAEKTAQETAERNRHEQIERDEYWKRREQIYQLLGSENPGLRLGAVALLTELADSAAHSTLLNDTEKQHLQRHIIDTLCLQVRHEGMSQTHEGSQNEHAEIQRAILDAIQMRINCNATRKAHAANWSTHHIRLTDTHFLTSIIIDNITTHSTIDLSNSDLQQTLQIKNSKIKHVIWNGTTFHNGVKIGGMDKPVTIEIDEIPQNSTETTFQNVTIITRKQTLTIRTN